MNAIKPETEWVLVPKEPTPEMRHAGFGTADDDNNWRWAAMLAASPPAPSVLELVKEFEAWAEGRPARDTELGRRMAAALTQKQIEWVGMKSEVQLCHAKLDAQAKTIEGLAPLKTILDMTESATGEQVVEQVKRLVADKIQARATATELRAENTRFWEDVKNARAEVERLTGERDLALAHDTQPYPTAEAYEKVCAARTAWEARATTAESSLQTARGALEMREALDQEWLAEAIARAQLTPHGKAKCKWPDEWGPNERIDYRRQAAEILLGRAALPSPPITKIKGEG